MTPFPLFINKHFLWLYFVWPYKHPLFCHRLYSFVYIITNSWTPIHSVRFKLLVSLLLWRSKCPGLGQSEPHEGAGFHGSRPSSSGSPHFHPKMLWPQPVLPAPGWKHLQSDLLSMCDSSSSNLLSREVFCFVISFF